MFLEQFFHRITSITNEFSRQVFELTETCEILICFEIRLSISVMLTVVQDVAE